MNKPKEFWLSLADSPDERIFVLEDFGDEGPDDELHVIEKSAYDWMCSEKNKYEGLYEATNYLYIKHQEDSIELKKVDDEQKEWDLLREDRDMFQKKYNKAIEYLEIISEQTDVGGVVLEESAYIANEGLKKLGELND